jgi:glycosyltransferase involved in cell wall biosynthesis
MRRIALLTHGGLDEPGTGVRIPLLAGIVEGLARTHDITVLSLSTYGASRLPVRIALLLSDLYRRHRNAPYLLVHGIWAVPSGAMAVGAARILGIPSVVSLHGAETASVRSIGYGNMGRQPHRWLTFQACRRADALVVLSDHQRRALRRLGITRGDIRVMPPAADPVFLRVEPRPFPAEPVQFLHVANLTEVKDQTMLLRAFARILLHRNARLRIVGPDHLHGQIQSLSRAMQLEPHVDFLGYVPRLEMPEQFRWAHILLQSSLHEAGGVAVAEAASAGTVICGTATGLLDDLQPHAALGVTPGDDEGLAREILALLADPQRCARMRANARAWAEANTIESAVKMLEEAYDNVLER